MKQKKMKAGHGKTNDFTCYICGKGIPPKKAWDHVVHSANDSFLVCAACRKKGCGTWGDKCGG